MKFFFLCVFTSVYLSSIFLTNSLARAEEDMLKSDEAMLDPMKGFTLTKADIKISLDNLKKEGKISESDYKKSLAQLDGMNETQIKLMKEAAMGIVKNNPDKADEVLKAKKINSSDVEKQFKDLSSPKPK